MIIKSSFRDNSGFLFLKDNILYRQINQFYKDDYNLLMSSGLYKELAEENLLIPHEEVDNELAMTGEVYKVIKPEFINFISYPYEWSFSQLKDSALTTLEIQKRAYEKGMVLKDASAYNIQFFKGRPVFIDTLSLTKYKDGEPWIAYKQFCQHFLAPLILMSYKDVRLSQLLKIYIDGIPLDLTSSLLPFSTKFNFSLLSHIHLHSKSQKHYENKHISRKDLKTQMSSFGFQGIIDSLESCVKKLKWKPASTEWFDYYKKNNYSLNASDKKKSIVEKFIDDASPGTLWDLGGNIGLYTRLASDKGIRTICFDIDPACVEINYSLVVERKEKNILPLLIDLTNPTPGIGWVNQERLSFIKRGPVDCIMALALVHHLAISNNVPLNYIAEFFSSLCKFLIIEFIPRSDSQVKKLLLTREDIFPDYTQDYFEKVFKNYFIIKESHKIVDSERTLYLMIRK